MTYLYEVYLQSWNWSSVKILCLGLEEITGKVSCFDLDVLKTLFPPIDSESLQRKLDTVGMLIESDYCGLHLREEIAT